MSKDRRDIIIARIRRTLRGMPFPSSKKGIVEYARNWGADNGALERLNGISDRRYRAEGDVLGEIERRPGL